MSGRMEGKVALVTGGARGLGRAMVEAMVAEGGRVAVGDVRTADAEALATSLGDAVLALALDVTVEEQWAAAVDATVAAFGRLDVLVNNAGTATGGPFAEATLADWERVIAVNQTGVFLGMRAVIPALTVAGGGSIVNISSIDGMTGAPRVMSYVASKWAVRGMTKAAAMELAHLGVRVNSVHPGYVVTDLALPDGVDRSVVAPLIEEHAERSAPLRRTGRPSEIAAMVVFLASDESSYATGAEFVVDGGMTAGYPSPGSPHPW